MGGGHRGLLRSYSSAPIPANPPPPNIDMWGPLVAHSLLCTCPHLASAVPSRSGTSCVLCLDRPPPPHPRASWLMPLLWRSLHMPLHTPCPWIPPEGLSSSEMAEWTWGHWRPPPLQRRKGIPGTERAHGARAGSAKAGGQVQRVLSCKGLGSQLGSLSSGPSPCGYCCRKRRLGSSLGAGWREGGGWQGP